MLRLPKNVQNHPHLAQLEAHFSDSVRPIKPDSAVLVSHWAFDATLRATLKIVYGTGHLIQGLELITETLNKEQRGLRAAQEKAGLPPPQRMSRLMLLSNDGTDRFYKDAETLLRHHGDRLWACVVDVGAAELGLAFTPKGNPAKALMIDDRDALGLFLASLVSGLAQ